ncbi:hypothetical protein [Pantoea dispersa]|uniref:Uncharacterized protein n=1 Tax=Pantoea dispersa TaxID=59814 RepID=A0ABY2ZZI9_9GAMM|nr:hypothetical protein [Pantoea dispersa]TQC75590.1 hypothetical protein FK492_06625 [Pantoea dispersa]
MSNEISNERLEKLAAQETMREQAQMAKELLALRMAFSVPVYWEIAGHIFADEEDALSYGYTGKPEPLYSKPEV